MVDLVLAETNRIEADYFGFALLSSYRVRPYKSTAVSSCETCSIQLTRGVSGDGSQGLYKIDIKPNSKVVTQSTSPLAARSMTVCVFCIQALTLDPRFDGDGIVYLLPEISQRNLLRLVVYANMVIQDSTSSSDASKGARRFLDQLNRVGIARWRIVDQRAWTSNFIAQYREHLAAIPDPDLKRSASLHASRSLRYIPVMNAANLRRLRTIQTDVDTKALSRLFEIDVPTVDMNE